MSGWNDFFSSSVGASATLTGLIFIGISNNLKKILASPKLPKKALLPLILLLSILLTSLLYLIPEQTNVAIGLEILLIGISSWIAISAINYNILVNTHINYKKRQILNIALDQIAVIPYLIAAALILQNNNDGHYWIVASVLFSFVKAIVDAWVLLVEINKTKSNLHF